MGIDAVLLAQTIAVSCMAGWMVSAVSNNWLRPKLNLEAIAYVMRFELMEKEFPEDYDHVAHRKIQSPRLHRLAFAMIVLSETLAALTLAAGAIALWIALIGGGQSATALTIAVVGVCLFTVNWTGFLIGGEYFCYWYCHFNAQATHMLLLIWGVLTLVLLAAGGSGQPPSASLF